jgi:dihydropteroate synthase
VRIMGVINLTRDSFYKGSVVTSKNQILQRAIQMLEDGADFIDLGASSTAPFRKFEISEQVEARLVSEAIRTLAGRINVPISVDTRRVSPATQALKDGVSIINDPYGLRDEGGLELAKLVGRSDASMIITAHEVVEGQSHNPILRVVGALTKSLSLAKRGGVTINKIVIDPGIGFFSDPKLSHLEWNTLVLANLDKLRQLGLPLMVGVSRKKFLGILGGGLPPEDRLPGSLSATAIAVYNGAHLIRTHDVRETRQAVAVASKIKDQAKKGLSPNAKRAHS